MTDVPFRPSAHLYDVTYSNLDYERHAAQVASVIRERCPGARSVLDVACGTGRHLAIWDAEFPHRVGLDIDTGMLAVAAARLPGVPLHTADMVDFDLGRTFDAVTCLSSSIGYARTGDALDRAVAAMARHVAPGGVLVIEPWLQAGMVQPPHIRLHVVEQPDVMLARTSRTVSADDEVSDMEFVYLVTTPDGSETITERHVMGLFTPAEFLSAFAAAGLDGEWDPAGTLNDRGLAIGVRPH